MGDPNIILAAASLILVATGILSGAILRGWNAWLELKRLELQQGEQAKSAPARARIEVAALKERVRKLEAIASGVDI